jgi:hypothetical protein
MTAPEENQGPRLGINVSLSGKWLAMTRAFTVAMLLSLVGSTAADAQDLTKLLKELVPCKSAATRLCDRSQGINVAALWKCGATLAARQQEVGSRCVDVLKRHGQL